MRRVLLTLPLLAAGPALPPGEWETTVKARSLASAELLPKGVAEDAVARVVTKRHCLDAADVSRGPASVFLAGHPGCRVARDASTAQAFDLEIACADGRKGRMRGRLAGDSYTAVSEMSLPRGIKLVADVGARRLHACEKPKPKPPEPPADPAATPPTGASR